MRHSRTRLLQFLGYALKGGIVGVMVGMVATFAFLIQAMRSHSSTSLAESRGFDAMILCAVAGMILGVWVGSKQRVE